MLMYHIQSNRLLNLGMHNDTLEVVKLGDIKSPAR